MKVYAVHATTADLSSVVKRKGVRNWTLGCFVCFFIFSKRMFLVYFKSDLLIFLIKTLCDRHRRDEMQDDYMPNSYLNY